MDEKNWYYLEVEVKKFGEYWEINGKNFKGIEFYKNNLNGIICSFKKNQLVGMFYKEEGAAHAQKFSLFHLPMPHS